MRDNRAQFFIDLTTTDPSELRDLAREAEKAADGLDALGAAAKESSTDATEAASRWADMERALKIDGVDQVIDGLREIAQAAVAVAQSSKGVIDAVAVEQQALVRWAGAVGVTVREMEGLARVGRLVGGSFTDAAEVGDLIQEIGDRAKEAATGNEAYAATFKSLGVAVTENGEMRAAGDIFVEVSEKLGRMENQTFAMAIAGDLLSDLGRQWISTVREYGGSLSDLLAELDDFGTMTEGQRDQMRDYRKALFELGEANEQLSRTLATEAGPAVAEFRREMATALTQVVQMYPRLGVLIALAREGAPMFTNLALAIVGVAAGLRALGVNAGSATRAMRGLWGVLVGLGPIGLAVAAALGAVVYQLSQLWRESGRAREGAADFNDKLGELHEQGYLSADAVRALRIELDKVPNAFDNFSASLYENLIAPIQIGMLSIKHPFKDREEIARDYGAEIGAILSGPDWYRRAKGRIDSYQNDDRGVDLAPRDTYRAEEPSLGSLAGDGDTGPSAEEKRRQAAQAKIDAAAAARAQAERLRAEAARRRASSTAGPTAGGVRPGDTVSWRRGDYGHVAVVGPDGYVYEVTSADRGETIGGYRRRMPVDDYLAYAEARGEYRVNRPYADAAQAQRFAEQYKRNIYNPPNRYFSSARGTSYCSASAQTTARSMGLSAPSGPGSAWFDFGPAVDVTAGAQAADAALSEAERKAAALEQKAAALEADAYRMLGDTAALAGLGTKAAQDAIDALRADAELELARADTAIAAAEAAGDWEATRRARDAKRAKELGFAQAFGGPQDVERVKAQQIRERAQEAEEASRRAEAERAAAAQAAIRLAEDELRVRQDVLDAMREQGATLDAMLAASAAIRAQEEAIAALRRDDALANLEPDDDAAAESDFGRAQAAAAREQERRDRDIRRSIVERREREIRARLSAAEAEANLGDVEAGHEGARGEVIANLQSLERHYMAVGDAASYYETRLRRLRYEEEAGKATLAEQILAAGPGAGAIGAFLRQRYGVAAARYVESSAADGYVEPAGIRRSPELLGPPVPAGLDVGTEGAAAAARNVDTVKAAAAAVADEGIRQALGALIDGFRTS